MLYLNDYFENYEGFKSLFQDREGKRRNSILLAFLKWKREYILHNGDRILSTYKRVWRSIETEDLYSVIMDYLGCYSSHKAQVNHFILQMNDNYKIKLFSSKYSTDYLRGQCEDGDGGSIRYINLDNNKVYKMKCGKFIRKIMDETAVPLPEQIKAFVSEMFTSKWKTNHQNTKNSFELHINDRFEDIYDSDSCAGDFGSCMTDDAQWQFYRDAVDASAAYITKDGKIYARCIIFNEVQDEDTGETLRLAERQYSLNGNLLYKEILVNLLKKSGEIDGYKKVGASYDDPTEWLSVNDEDWSNKSFHVSCNLSDGDTLSYQDTFKWYDEDDNTAYNYEYGSSCQMLDTCEPQFCSNRRTEYHAWSDSDEGYCFYEGDRDWVEENCALIDGEWYDEWVEVNGIPYRKDDEDIVYCEDDEQYYFEDYLYYCPNDDSWRLPEKVVEINDEWYSCEDDDITYCEDDKEYHLKGDLVLCHNLEYHLTENCVEINGEWHHENEEGIEYVNIGEYNYILSDDDTILIFPLDLFELANLMDQNEDTLEEYGIVKVEGNLYNTTNQKIMQNENGEWVLNNVA